THPPHLDKSILFPLSSPPFCPHPSSTITLFSSPPSLLLSSPPFSLPLLLPTTPPLTHWPQLGSSWYTGGNPHWTPPFVNINIIAAALRLHPTAPSPDPAAASAAVSSRGLHLDTPPSQHLGKECIAHLEQAHLFWFCLSLLPLSSLFNARWGFRRGAQIAHSILLKIGRASCRERV